MSSEIIVKNIKQCPVCQTGTVNKHRFHFECKDCKAVGDLVTGIMQPNLDKKVLDKDK